MNRYFVAWLCLAPLWGARAQFSTPTDSVQPLAEVVLIGAKKQLKNSTKIGNSVEEYLQTAQGVSLIKRGAYAWEPSVAGLGSERSVITLDGMYIFGACTDKMDPITSYVETANLSEVEICTGQEGNACGAAVAGSINLKRKRGHFSASPKGNAQLENSYGGNNGQFFVMGLAEFSSAKSFANASLSFRKAGAYYAGGGQKIAFSQYQKYNASVAVGRKIGTQGALQADIIFDKAQNVGYPALPMDVSLAQAIIGSVSYKTFFGKEKSATWETKLYANQITHVMDDSQRPEVPIRMDMPGKNQTLGLSSKISQGGSFLQLNAYTNLSTAEMTMYPKMGKEMFMYTWGGITHSFAGIAASQNWEKGGFSFSFGGNLGVQYQHIGKKEAYQSLKIFYPDASRSATRFLPGISVGVQKNIQNCSLQLNLGYAQRAPSVSEGYGFYLFNSADAYDYLGNPELKNESAYQSSLTFSGKHKSLAFKAKAAYFHLRNYVAGRVTSLSAMTYQARGVKQYQNLPYAQLWNFSAEISAKISRHHRWTNTFGYSYAADNEQETLPMIPPVELSSKWQATFGRFSAEISALANLKKNRVNPNYAELPLPAFVIGNASCQYRLPTKTYLIDFQAGIENIFDKYYTTYSDWNRIPRMGRNIFAGISCQF